LPRSSSTVRLPLVMIS